jgi:hypothetical protein
MEPEDRPEAFNQHRMLAPGDVLDVVQELKLSEFRRQPIFLDLARFNRCVVRPAPGIPDEFAARIPQRNADEPREVAAIAKPRPKVWIVAGASPRSAGYGCIGFNAKR